MSRTDNLKPFKKGEVRAKKAGRKGGSAKTGRFKDNPELARQVALAGWEKRRANAAKKKAADEAKA